MGKFEKKSESVNTAKKTSQNSAKNTKTRTTQAQKAAKKKNKSSLPIWLGVGGAVLIVIACVIGFFILRNDEKGVQPPQENYIIDNAYVAGVNIGGMTREQAITALRAEFTPVDTAGADEETAKELANTVTFGEKMQNLDIYLYTAANNYALFTTTYDPSAENASDALDNPIENPQNPVAEPNASEEPVVDASITPPMQENGEPYQLENHVCIPASYVSVSFDVEAVVEAAYQYGRTIEATDTSRVDIDISKHLVIDDGGYIDDVLQSISERLDEGKAMTYAKGKTFINDEDGNPIEVDCIEISLGSVGRKIDKAALKDNIVRAYMVGQFRLQYVYNEETFPTQVDLDQLFEEYDCVAPVDADYDKTTFEVIEETVGWGFSMKEAYAKLVNAQPGDVVILPLTDLQPAKTKQQVEDAIAAENFPDVLATYDSPHVYNPVRTRNLELACEAIDGTILMPNDVFSFNEIVGERTKEKGYGEAAVYVGGRTEDQLGGGVCQVASTIYWCTLTADLEVVQRAEHRYTPTYVPWGMDATIYWKSLDYKFRNNTAYPIKIDASVSDGYVHITFRGMETKDYTVKLFYEIQDSQKSGVKTIYIHPDMENYSEFSGYKHGQTIQTAYDGYTVYTYMQKLDAEGNVISTTRVNISTYKSRDKEVAYLLDPSIPMNEQIDSNGNLIETTKPTETTTEPTESTTEPTEPTESTEESTEPTETPEPIESNDEPET